MAAWGYVFVQDVSSNTASGVGISYAMIYELIYSLFLISGALILIRKRITKVRMIIVLTVLSALIVLRVCFSFPIETVLHIPQLKTSIDPNLIAFILILCFFCVYMYGRRGKPI